MTCPPCCPPAIPAGRSKGRVLCLAAWDRVPHPPPPAAASSILPPRWSRPSIRENGQQLRYSAAFDRATGQRLDLWTLFTVPEADARMALAAAAGDDPAVQETLAAAIDPVHVIFFEDRLEVEFPAGSLEGLDTAYILVVDYAQLDGVLASSALPGGAERS